MNSCSVESPDPFSDSERPGGWFRFLTFWEKREEGGLKRVETYFGINPEFLTSLNRISTESIQFSHFEFSRQEIWKLYENRETVKILKSHTIWVIWTKIIWNWYYNLERIQKFKFENFLKSVIACQMSKLNENIPNVIHTHVQVQTFKLNHTYYYVIHIIEYNTN